MECDALDFQNLLKRASTENGHRLHTLREAVGLWGAPLWNGGDFDWLREESAYLNNLFCEAALAISSLDAPDGLEALQRAVLLEPSREDIAGALIQSLVTQSKTEEAIRTWRTFERLLRTEHNRAPSSEIRTLVRRLLEVQESPHDSAHIERLSTNSTRFFGRNKELDLLSSWLARESGLQLITVFGGSGHGKTRLALEAARRNAESFDSVHFVSLLGQYDARQILEIIGDAIQAPRSSSLSPVERIANEIGGHRVLLVLDNFEHLASGAPDIERLIRRIPSVVCLLTSRCLLEIEGEQQLVLSPLPTPAHANETTEGVPDALVLEEWARNPSIRLFADRARAVSPTFRFSRNNARAVARLCQALAGVPLALELAAARTLVLSPAQIEQYLKTHLDILEQNPHSKNEERHRSLRAALDWSYDLLSPTARRLFRRLSVFRGSWTLENADAICAVSQRDDTAVIVRAHEELRRHSLIEAEDEKGEIRFRFLETVRLYAGERAARDDKREVQRALETRHAREFARIAQNAVRAGRGEKSSQWARLLELDLPDLRAALNWALENDAALSLRFAASLWGFWFSTSRLAEGREFLNRALNASDHLSNAELQGEEDSAESILWRAEALGGAGFLAWRQGDLMNAIQLCQQACDMCRTEGDTRALTYALLVLQLAALIRCEFDLLWAMSEECLALARASGDQHAEAFALHLKGAGIEAQGDALAGWSLQEQSLALFEEVNSPEGMAWALMNWGNAARHLGETERATGLCAQASERFQSISSREGVAYCAVYAGLAYCDVNDKEQALPRFQKGLRELSDLKAIWGIALTLEGIARTHFDSTEKTAIEATRLWSTAQSIRSLINTPIPPIDATLFAEFEHRLREVLPAPSFDAAWAIGRSRPVEQSVRAALEL